MLGIQNFYDLFDKLAYIGDFLSNLHVHKVKNPLHLTCYLTIHQKRKLERIWLNMMPYHKQSVEHNTDIKLHTPTHSYTQ